MKIKYTITFILLFMVISQTNVFAIDYSNRYTEYYGINGVATAQSPFHLNNTDTGSDDFTIPTHRINGPNNQPRYLNGVSDLLMKAN